MFRTLATEADAEVRHEAKGGDKVQGLMHSDLDYAATALPLRSSATLSTSTAPPLDYFAALLASTASLCRPSSLDCTSLRGLAGLDYASLCHLPLLDPALPLDHGSDGLR